MRQPVGPDTVDIAVQAALGRDWDTFERTKALLRQGKWGNGAMARLMALAHEALIADREHPETVPEEVRSQIADVLADFEARGLHSGAMEDSDWDGLTLEQSEAALEVFDMYLMLAVRHRLDT